MSGWAQRRAEEQEDEAAERVAVLVRLGEAERRIRELEHSNRVLTETLERARAELADRVTVWDHYAAAVLTGLVTRGPAAPPTGEMTIGELIARTAISITDAMMAARRERTP